MLWGPYQFRIFIRKLYSYFSLSQIGRQTNKAIILDSNFPNVRLLAFSLICIIVNWNFVIFTFYAFGKNTSTRHWKQSMMFRFTAKQNIDITRETHSPDFCLYWLEFTVYCTFGNTQLRTSNQVMKTPAMMSYDWVDYMLGSFIYRERSRVSFLPCLII